MSHLHQAVLILSIFYVYSGVRKFSCLIVDNGARMPAFFPLRAWTLPLRYGGLSTKRGYGGEDPYGSCEKSKPTSVVYSTPFRRSLSNYPFRSIRQFRLGHVDCKRNIYFLCATNPYPTGSAILAWFLSQSEAILGNYHPPETFKEPSRPPLCLES